MLLENEVTKFDFIKNRALELDAVDFKIIFVTDIYGTTNNVFY
jgi:hypothetical protein